MMTKLFRSLMPTLIILSLLTACENRTDSPKETTPPPVRKTYAPADKIMQTAIEPQTFELPSEALQAWREHRDEKPPLVLFSIHPLMAPVEPAQRAEVIELVNKGMAETFRERGSYNRSNPLILPLQTVSAAIEAGLISELIWMFPSTGDFNELTLETFRNQLLEAGFLTEEEAATVTLAEGTFSGVVRGIPFKAVHPMAEIPILSRPAIIHLDLGYFKGMYKNEVSTPLYQILQETALLMRDSEWQSRLTTLSYSTEDANFSLAVRFLVKDMAELIRAPEKLEQELPEHWKIRADALYSGTMYMEGASRELIAKAAEAFPDDPAALYAYAQLQLQQGNDKQAFELLDRAVALDRGYANDYIELAQTAAQRGANLPALQLLDKAVGIYPENPFIDFNRASLLIREGRGEDALPLIEALKQRTWSSSFHPKALEHLAQMEEMIKNPPAEAQKADQ